MSRSATGSASSFDGQRQERVQALVSAASDLRQRWRRSNGKLVRHAVFPAAGRSLPRRLRGLSAARSARSGPAGSPRRIPLRAPGLLEWCCRLSFGCFLSFLMRFTGLCFSDLSDVIPRGAIHLARHDLSAQLSSCSVQVAVCEVSLSRSVLWVQQADRSEMGSSNRETTATSTALGCASPRICWSSPA